MNMNSKKNKKNFNNSELMEDASDNAIPKKTKKKKTEITNENTNLENKSKKRKLVIAEPEVVPPKKAKKKLKSITCLENNMEIPPADDIENNVPSAKNSKRKNNIDKTIIPEDIHYNTIEDPEVHKKTEQIAKKGKKKKKKEDVELEAGISSPEVINEDPGEGVSSTKNIKHSKNSNQLVSVEGSKEAVFNSSKKLIHEVKIVDIKDEVNEDNENVVTISIKDVEGMDSDWDENDLLKQLERKVDKVPKEKKVVIQWPDSDLLELVERMEVGLPENDLKPYAKRTDELEWDKIAFKNYSIEDCKKTWSLVLKRIRRYRILKEVIHDAKQWITAPKSIKKQAKVQRHPDMPRRPLSAYFIYYLKKKDAMHAEHPGMDAAELAKLCSQKFKLLPPEKMVKYENIAKKNREEYDQKMKEFYIIHPELKVDKERSKKASRPPKPPKPPKPVKEKSPPKPPKLPKEKVPKRPVPAFQYYHIAELAKQAVEDKVAFKDLCRERWKEMPDDKKIEWITYAENENVKYEEEMKEYIKNHPDFENNVQKPQLTKEELLVKERVSGKPAKPPVSAYNLFARIMLHSDDIKNVPVKERLVFVSNQWKECNEEQKKYYKELFDKTIAKYNQDLAAYLESLPEEERKLELLKIQPKRRKSEDEKTKKEKPKKPSKKKVEPKLEKKKITPKPVEKKVEKVEKVEKVDGKKPRKLIEPEQPPISPFKYFATLYTGEEPVAKAWKALSPEEKDKYEEELVQKKKAYILDFEKFLKSMTKEELENFSNSRKKLNNQKAEDEEDDDEDEDETSEQSDSEDNSEDSDDEEN